ncbi:MAG: hypothetical protein IPG74_10155 [Flavobacteriales bacterium]|nr:hypothetical protein [Flavobacteriales bacterium]
MVAAHRIDLTNDFDASVVTANAIGVFTVGPFPSGTTVTVTMEATNALCDVVLGAQTYTCPPANDLCANAIAVACNSVTAGTTLNSTIDAVGTCTTALNTAGGVWYTFVGTGGNTKVSLCGSAYDTKLGVFTTPDCVTFTCIEGNDDDTDGNGFNVCTNDLHSSLEFLSTLGQTYHVLVTGFSTNTGNFILEITCGGLNTPLATTTVLWWTSTRTTSAAKPAGRSFRWVTRSPCAAVAVTPTTRRSASIAA